MEFNDNVLVKQAIDGLYGGEVKKLAKKWVIKQLVTGKDIPVSLSDCFGAYEDFDEAFADEFALVQNWTALWLMLNRYDKADESDLALPRIAGSVVARFIDDNNAKQLKAWIQVSVNDERMVGVVLEKSKNAPELLEWCLTYLTKFSAFSDSAALIDLIRDIATQHPKFLMQAVNLIIHLGQQRSLQQGYVRLTAMEAMTQIYAMANLSNSMKTDLLEKIDEFAQSMNGFELQIFLGEDVYLPCAFKILLAKKALKSLMFEGNEADLLEVVDSIYHAGITAEPNNRLIVDAWCEFIKLLAQKRHDLCYDLFLQLNDAISNYVEVHDWTVALMYWNPGMNFSCYDPEFKKLTLLSLELANLSGHFRPRAFLTALNIVVFDASGKFGVEWFDNYLKQMPQNLDNDSLWDGDFSSLFEHLAMLYRYRVEIQKQDAELVLNRAKIFVTCLMSNYALNASQLEQLRSLCARLNLEVDMETEVKKMERRREQIAHKRRAEWNHLLQLFSC